MVALVRINCSWKSSFSSMLLLKSRTSWRKLKRSTKTKMKRIGSWWWNCWGWGVCCWTFPHTVEMSGLRTGTQINDMNISVYQKMYKNTLNETEFFMAGYWLPINVSNKAVQYRNLLKFSVCSLLAPLRKRSLRRARRGRAKTRCWEKHPRSKPRDPVLRRSS